MPRRILEPTIHTNRKINSISDFQFRLWAYLLTYVDDYGRGSADPELLKGFLFPRRRGITESSIEQALTGLANAGLIRIYEVKGEPHLYFPNWSEHQRIQRKYSEFPAPPTEIDESTVSHRESPSSTVSHRESPLEVEVELEEEIEVEEEVEHELCAHARESETLHQLGTNLRPTCGQLAAKPEPASTVPERDLFGEFWAMYPKKVAKQAAERAYKRLNPNAELHKKILENIILQKKSRQWTENGGQYIPNPATYINGRRWEDEGVKSNAEHGGEYRETVSETTGAKIAVDRFGNKVYL